MLSQISCLLWPNFVSNAVAYERMRTQMGAVTAWPNMPISYYIGSQASGAGDQEEILAIHRAFQTWAAVDCARVSFAFSGLIDNPIAEYLPNAQNQNHIFWVKSPSKWPFPIDVLAAAILGWEPYTGIIHDADILFNGFYFQWSTAPTPPPEHYDIENTIVHEIGHLLGLDHSDIPEATMYGYSGIGETSKRELHPDDREGICAIYPRDSKSIQFEVISLELGLDPCHNAQNHRSQGCSQLDQLNTPDTAVLYLILLTLLLLKGQRWQITSMP